jgi:hypothetical protein
VRTILTALVLFSAVYVAAGASAPDDRADLSGIYLCEGVNPDGSPYKGLVEITRKQASYTVEWTLAASEVRGVGIFRGGMLAVSYFGGSPGVVVYRIEAGRLIGEWTVGNANGHLFSETLTKLPKQLRERLKREGTAALIAA